MVNIDDPIFYGFAATFFVFSLGSTLNAIYAFYTKPGFSFNVKIILAMIPLATTVRGFSLVWGDHVLGQPWYSHSNYDIIVGGLPGYLFLSCYLLLALFWVVLLHEAHDRSPTFLTTVKRSYVFLNLIIYIIWLAFVIAIISTPSPDIKLAWHTAEAIYASSLYFLSSSLFCLVGFKLYRHLNRLPTSSQVRKKLARRIGILTIFCTIIFGIRAIEIPIALKLTDETDTLILSSVFLVLCELVPSAAMMVMLTPGPPQTFEEQPLLPDKSNINTDIKQ